MTLGNLGICLAPSRNIDAQHYVGGLVICVYEKAQGNYGFALVLNGDRGESQIPRFVESR